MTKTEDCLSYMPLSSSPGYTEAVKNGLVTIDGKYLCDEKLPGVIEKNDPVEDISCVGYGNPGCPKTELL